VSDIDLINQIIDLKVSAAMAVVMGEMQKLAQAHNTLANDVVPPLVQDLERRKKEQDRMAREAAEARVAALEAKLAQADERIAALTEKE
jgi:hypothetical protein